MSMAKAVNPARIGVSSPNIARVYDALLGGLLPGSMNS